MANVSSHPCAIQTMTVNLFIFAQNCFSGLKTTEIPLRKDATLYLLKNTDLSFVTGDCCSTDMRAACIGGGMVQ